MRNALHILGKIFLSLVVVVVLFIGLYPITSRIFSKIVIAYPTPVKHFSSYDETCKALKNKESFIPNFGDMGFENVFYNVSLNGRSIFAKAEKLESISLSAEAYDNNVKFNIETVDTFSTAVFPPSYKYNGVPYYNENGLVKLKLGEQCYQIGYYRVENIDEATMENIKSYAEDTLNKLAQELIDQYNRTQ